MSKTTDQQSNPKEKLLSVLELPAEDQKEIFKLIDVCLHRQKQKTELARFKLDGTGNPKQ